MYRGKKGSRAVVKAEMKFRKLNYSLHMAMVKSGGRMRANKSQKHTIEDFLNNSAITVQKSCQSIHFWRSS